MNAQGTDPPHRANVAVQLQCEEETEHVAETHIFCFIL